MALAMPSRFAVLKIEDDDFRPANQNKAKDKKKAEKQNGKKAEKPSTTVKKPTKKKDKKKKESSDQWEQWKQKDSELVDGTFEEDLHTAILQSKLDFEEKKNKCKTQKKEPEPEKKPNDVQLGKKKKNKAMSLEQFKNLVSNNQESHRNKGEENENSHKAEDNDDTFFERISTDAKVEINKEYTKELSKESKKVRKSFNNDTITIAHLQEKLDALQLENVALRSQLESAKKEVFTVKTRNRALCVILASGEMKDKADILMELEKFSRIREELTDEVTRLNGLLEQERSRSKVGAQAVEPHPPHNKHKEKHRKKGKE